MKSQLFFKLKNDISEISRLADNVEQFCKSNRVIPTSTFEINLVMDEIVSNIIMHGYIDDDEHFIEINFAIDEQTFSAKIVDDGKEFNPLTSTRDDRAASLEEKNSGGLGIHIIKKYADKVDYSRLRNKNILTISKRIELNK